MSCPKGNAGGGKTYNTRGEFFAGFNDANLQKINTQLVDVENKIKNFNFTMSTNIAQDTGGIRSESTKTRERRYNKQLKETENIGKLRDKQQVLSALKENYIKASWKLESANRVLSSGMMNGKALTNKDKKTITEMSQDYKKDINRIASRI